MASTVRPVSWGCWASFTESLAEYEGLGDRGLFRLCPAYTPGSDQMGLTSPSANSYLPFSSHWPQPQ